MGEAKRFGRYEVRDVIGKGAMGIVYLAEDPLIGRKVAIKVVEIHEGIDDDELTQLQTRFEREFQSAGRLSHPNIVGVHDVGQEEGHAFIAMEYVRGEGLDSILAQRRAFSFKEIADLTAQIAGALDYAHEFGIVHRDIKPANILVTREGRPKISDFGVAKVATTTLTRTGTVVGTPAYMSPEQVTGHPVTGAADQFSLAVMIYQLLTGERPFTGENPTTIMYKIVHEKPVPPSVLNAMVPGPVDKALIRSLSKNPEARYPTCGELAEALRAALGAAPGDDTVVMAAEHTDETLVDASLQRPAGQPQSAEAGQGMRVLALAAAGVVVIGLAIGVWAWSMGGGDDPATAVDDPATTTPAAAPATIERSLRVDAGAGWGIWVDGQDTGRETPASIDLSGEAGEEVTVELRYGDLEPIATTVTLAEGMAASWAPLEAQLAAAAAAAAVAAAEEPDPEPEPPISFTITSNPAGARVTFNGEELGERTPAQVDVDLAGEHSVVVALDGYETQSWRFGRDDLNQGHLDSRELRFDLTPSTPPGVLSIDNPGYPVAVIAEPLDGGDPVRREAGTSHEIRLLPGRYRITLSAPSVYFEDVRTVSIASEQAVPIANLPRAVQVQVSAIPGNCTVSIDGRPVGPTPFGAQITIGEHEFTFDWSAIERGTKTVRIRVNANGQQIREAAGGGW